MSSLKIQFNTKIVGCRFIIQLIMLKVYSSLNLDSWFLGEKENKNHFRLSGISSVSYTQASSVVVNGVLGQMPHFILLWI